MHWKWVPSERPRWRRPEISRLALWHPEWRLRGISGDRWRPALALAARPADWGLGTFPCTPPSGQNRRFVALCEPVHSLARKLPTMPPSADNIGRFRGGGCGNLPGRTLGASCCWTPPPRPTPRWRKAGLVGELLNKLKSVVLHSILQVEARLHVYSP